MSPTSTLSSLDAWNQEPLPLIYYQQNTVWSNQYSLKSGGNALRSSRIKSKRNKGIKYISHMNFYSAIIWGRRNHATVAAMTRDWSGTETPPPWSRSLRLSFSLLWMSWDTIKFSLETVPCPCPFNTSTSISWMTRLRLPCWLMLLVRLLWKKLSTWPGYTSEMISLYPYHYCFHSHD